MNIISFYPGSAGNRFYLKLTDDFCWTDLSIDLDLHLSRLFSSNVNKEFKYETTIKTHINEEFFMTHVMNYDVLKKMFPNSTIYKIYTKDRYLSLRRFSRIWNKGCEDIFNLLAWHDNFYKQTGVDNFGDVIVDIDQGNEDFCKFVKKEFSIENKKFDLILNFYQEHGPSGPIIDFINSNGLQ